MTRSGARRMNDTLARLPQFHAVYNIGPGNTPDTYALQILGSILSGGRSSRFYQHLVHDKQLALNAFCRRPSAPRDLDSSTWLRCRARE